MNLSSGSLRGLYISSSFSSFFRFPCMVLIDFCRTSSETTRENEITEWEINLYGKLFFIYLLPGKSKANLSSDNLSFMINDEATGLCFSGHVILDTSQDHNDREGLEKRPQRNQAKGLCDSNNYTSTNSITVLAHKKFTQTLRFPYLWRLVPRVLIQARNLKSPGILFQSFPP